MRSAISRVPEYPRPVSPVCADEIPICEDTIIYYDGDEDIREDEQQRATKRRRIESEATAYLRGESLFILTAQLKGPFDNGWQNPWKRRRTATDNKESITGIVADKSAGKPALWTGRPSPPPSPSKKSASSSTVADATVRRKRSNPFPSETIQDRRLASTMTKDIGNVDRVNADRSSSEKNHRVEDWLKRNDSSVKFAYTQASLSSPSTKKSPNVRRKKWEPSPIEVEMPPVLDAIVHVARSLHTSRLPLTTPLAHGDKSNLEHAQPVALQLDTRDETATKPARSLLRGTGALEEPLKQRRGTARDSELSNKGSRTNSSRDRLVSSRQPAQDAHTSRPHPTSLREEAQRRGVIEGATGAVFASLSAAPEGQLPTQSESILAVSKDRPSMDTMNDLPSAQVPPQPTLPSGPSNISSNDEMLELLAVPVHSHALGVEWTEASATPANVGTEPNPSDSTSDEYRSPSGFKGADRKQIETPRPDGNKDLKSYSITTSERGTARVAKTKKRASFILSEKSPGSSQVSIKSAMKVAKPAALNQTHVNAKSVLSQTFGNGGQPDMEPTSPPGLKKILKSSRMMTAPKGILKSSLSTSLGPPMSSINATSSGSKQDAQQQAQLEVVEQGIGTLDDDDDDDDGFDIDAAIDDVGSYLGTWDAEKEAALVSSTSG